MPRAAFVYEDALSQHVLRQDHPMKPIRLSYTYQLLDAYGAFGSGSSRLVKPREAMEEELGWLHTLTPKTISICGLSGKRRYL